MARALFRKPKVLIIDEGTSALDSITTSKIIKILTKIKKEIIIICVTHNADVIRASDKVFELKGKSLIAHNKKYEN